MLRLPLPLTRKRRFGVYALFVSAALAMPQSLHPATTIEIPFDPANFSNPLQINNPLFPLVAGKTFIYEGAGADGCEETRTAVTNQTKTIAGVTARVVHDAVYAGPCGGRFALIEDTDDWYAQDNYGNVWYLGEDSKDCQGPGRCVRNSGSWETGVNGARAGLIMLAHPNKGDSYRQEYYAGFAEDEATVVAVDLTVTLTRPDAIPPRQFAHCIRTKEFTRLEPGAIAYKYYCPNYGLVREEEKDGEAELVAIR